MRWIALYPIKNLGDMRFNYEKFDYRWRGSLNNYFYLCNGIINAV